ncbi:tetratricopeptide repeat protein [Candidatus Woesebacteria bacterium]|nr:tetratricopeptide repeat protein [Candidatus Woesebacteria bacterium]
MHQLQDKAIKSALSGDWEAAVEYNLEILADSPQNITALNRLGRAYTELGQKEAAKDAYEQVLKIDKYDTIASKNLKLLPHQKNNMSSVELADEDFIELPGITKSTSLIKVASRDILLSLVCKQKLTLTPRTRLIAIYTDDKTCIGCLPDDLSLKLQGLIKSGYTYTACLKGASDNTATIFIREAKRPKKPSASPTFSRSNSIHKSK